MSAAAPTCHRENLVLGFALSRLGAWFWFSCLDSKNNIQTLFLKNLWFSRDLKPLTSHGRLSGAGRAAIGAPTGHSYRAHRPRGKGPRVN